MILSGLQIEKNIGKDIIIEPFNRKQLNSNSYNVRLHNKLLVYKDKVLDMKKLSETKEIIIPESGYELKPNELYLGRTLEYTKTKKYVPMIEGRSSIGRLGIFIHITAGFGDVGFAGYWTLEIFCIKPIIIYPNVEIAQLYYHTIDGEYEEYNSSKYQNNTDVQPGEKVPFQVVFFNAPTPKYFDVIPVVAKDADAPLQNISGEPAKPVQPAQSAQPAQSPQPVKAD